MAIKLPVLPFELNDLEPHLSKQTVVFHYGKHHKKYVSTLNELIKNTQYDSMTLEEIMCLSYREDEKIFNNAAQAWNHSFFWNCLTHKRHLTQSESFNDLLELNFGSFASFQSQFNKAALEVFGSGWTWLVYNEDKTLSIESTEGAVNPVVEGKIPLFTCDVWEHAYYLDYKNDREEYLKNVWPIVNWEFVENNIKVTPAHFNRTLKFASVDRVGLPH
jgi:Fe-Mn family superoxide dismutase